MLRGNRHILTGLLIQCYPCGHTTTVSELSSSLVMNSQTLRNQSSWVGSKADRFSLYYIWAKVGIVNTTVLKFLAAILDSEHIQC